MAQKGNLDRMMGELKEAFGIIARGQDKKINLQELGQLMRSIGLCPSQAQLMAIGQEYGADAKGTRLISEKECERIVQKNCHLVESKENILECLNIFDKDGTRSNSAAELRHVLTNLGECLTDEEFDEFVRDLNITGDGQIMCDEAADLLMSQM